MLGVAAVILFGRVWEWDAMVECGVEVEDRLRVAERVMIGWLAV